MSNNEEQEGVQSAYAQSFVTVRSELGWCARVGVSREAPVDTPKRSLCGIRGRNRWLYWEAREAEEGTLCGRASTEHALLYGVGDC